MAAALGKSLYVGVCRKMERPNCLSLLKQDPRITSAKNYLDLSRFILEFAVRKAREGKKYMLQIAKKHPTKLITCCAKSYESTITAFLSAKGELVGDARTATYDGRIAGDAPKRCAEAFKEANIENPPINKDVTLLSMLVYAMHDISKSIKCLTSPFVSYLSFCYQSGKFSRDKLFDIDKL
ncbi:hypothetical protein Lal_00035047 [Lupinus albus]|nr:hypothetical protein Lal_00035047 [Lupinus albus]